MEKDNKENLINLIDKKDIEIKLLNEKNKKLKKNNKNLKKKKNEVLYSKSWKITKPLRKLTKIFKGKSDNINETDKVIIKNKIINQLDEKVSIIIPIYNAYEDTKKCIESIFENTVGNFELILIDDNSPDKNVGKLLDSYESKDNVKIIRNKINQGFVKNVNIGFENSKKDVILLNSDTIVTPKWLQKLVVSAYSNDKIGTVTPVSNNAGAFSVPKNNSNNIIPTSLGINGMANIVEKSSERILIRVPTGNGFCMYIKRETIDSVGFFDVENFGKGYGEENDFCMRAIEKGWFNIIDESVYIYHKQGASFGNETNDLINKHRQIIELLYPNYTKEVRKFLSSKNMKTICNNVKDSLNDYLIKKSNKKNILFVLHGNDGGTPNTNKDLMGYVEKDYNCYLLISNGKSLTLYYYSKFGMDKINKWNLSSKWDFKKIYDDEFANIYLDILVNYSIDLVHVRQLINHTFDLIDISHKLGIYNVLSFHDFYLMCVSFNLLNSNHEYCKGDCDENVICNSSADSMIKFSNMEKFINKWRESVKEMFLNVDYFVTTSEMVKQLFIDTYPMLKNANFDVIEHGRDFNFTNNKYYEVPSLDKPIKILFLGNINYSKGAHIIKELYEFDTNHKFEFHFLGKQISELKKIGINHGKYKREQLPELIDEIKPSFIGIFSIWPETFCHTLTESWALGIPVLTTKYGALKERMLKYDAGWFINDKNIEEIYNLILNISSDETEYLSKQNNIHNIQFKTVKEMGDDYLDIYDNLLQ